MEDCFQNDQLLMGFRHALDNLFTLRRGRLCYASNKMEKSSSVGHMHVKTEILGKLGAYIAT